MKTRYRHIFFDLDHTLWDFHTNSRETLTDLFSIYKLSGFLNISDADFLEVYYRINDEKWELYRQGKIDKDTLRSERFLHTFHHFGCRDQPELCRRLEEEYIARSPLKTALLPGTTEVLCYLKEKYKLHIITNGFSEIQHIKLENSGLRPYFTEIITSEMMGENKPAARIFIESLKRAGAQRADSLMIGDNLAADVLGARNCGIDQVFFNPGGLSHRESITYEIRELKELLLFL